MKSWSRENKEVYNTIGLAQVSVNTSRFPGICYICGFQYYHMKIKQRHEDIHHNMVRKPSDSARHFSNTVTSYSLPASLFIFLILTLLFGCSPKSSISPLPVETPASFTWQGEAPAPDHWWTAFGNDQLNNMIDSALTNNFNLQVAWYRLQEAEAIVDRESASFFPFLEGNAQAEANRPAYQFQNAERYSLGLAASYEIDLWGRIGAQVKASRFRAEAGLEDYRAASISLAAEIAATWFQLIEAKNQVALATQQVETNEQTLRLIKNRLGTGQVRGVDMLRQQQLLEATRVQKIYAETRMETLEHRLLVLLGKPATDTLDINIDSLPPLPTLPETGIPSEWINRRPDVVSAYKYLEAADRDMAAAISNQYPRINLTASVSTIAEQPSNIFNDWFFSIAGDLLAPLFYGGQLRAEVDRTEAVKQQFFYEYGQTLLVAVQEVEDALIREMKLKEGIRNLENQLELAVKTNEQLRIEYFNGLSNYLDVLTALDREQQLRRDLLSARLTLLEYRISLYRVLAGGFETQREQTEE